ncbi:hypothetical protein HDE76_000025 [Rhodanobacter sp. ANJX3]|uniref:CBASS cGAMP synthase n=1 Tax=Rhodanobacter sp. ANJX3 TaxID=2723083 RepID=UPI0016116591|nr:hypothetical protein [Rhodanobacter sp. ANJX3]MBB5356843.1 hypothetical protein [Rhodanobacter sp. ANJX3]
MRKFTKLLHGDSAFYEAIVPTDLQESELRKAKNKIRDRLRVRIEAATKTKLGMEKTVAPRFRTQGSWAYRACVQPDHMPPQEMDWDYGVYLPVEAWEETGTPRVAAAAYFELVEALLGELAHEQGWRLGKDKNHCLRVHVAKWAHVDVALYAAPAEQFARVSDREIERVEKRAFDAATASLEQLNEASEISSQDWDDFEGMMVATRKGIWEPSDAEVIAGWFRDQLKIHGDQLQRVWRYVKAWRDHNWQEGGPTSVLLMLAICRHFSKQPGRDDKALAHVAQFIPAAVAGDYYEEGIDSEHNFNRLDATQRLDARNRAILLERALRESLTNVTQPKSAVVIALRGQLGQRIPNREADVETDSPADKVRETPARPVVTPVVKSSYAG